MASPELRNKCFLSDKVLLCVSGSACKSVIPSVDLSFIPA